jgi:sugar/nucleoside kinase (ribokinase family)
MINVEAHSSIAFGCDFTVDHYDQINQDLFVGSSIMSAVAARECGANVSLIGPVGEDENGYDFILRNREYMNTRFIRPMRGTTSDVHVNLDITGKKLYTGWNPGVMDINYHLREREFAWIHKHDAFVFSAYAPIAHLLDEIAIDRRTNRNSQMTFYTVDFKDMSQFKKDIGIVKKYLDVFDIFNFSLDENKDTQLIREIEQNARENDTLAIITLGENGAIATKGDESYRFYGRHLIPTDSTGAGDVHLAGFIVTYLQTGDIFQSLEAGETTAISYIQRFGSY